MASQSIDYAIIFSKRSFLNTVFRQEAKRRNIPQDHHVVTHHIDDCVGAVQKHTNAVLFLDWDLGAEALQRVLAVRQMAFQAQQQPCIVVASEMSQDIVSLCAEYGVHKVHTGEITADTIKKIFNDLTDEFDKLTPYRQIMIRCEKAQKEGDWETAEKILEGLLAKSPKDEDVASELGTLLMDREKWDPAHDVLTTFEDGEQTNPRILHLLARSYMHRREHENAIKVLEKAQLLSPLNIDRLMTMGGIFAANGQEEKACEAYDGVLSIDSSSKKAKSGKGTALLMMGDVTEALQLMQSRSKRDIASIFNNAAIICVRQNDYEKAIKLYDSCLMAIGNNSLLRAKLYFNRGVLFNKWGRISDAIKCFEQVLKLNPEHEDAQHNLKTLNAMAKQQVANGVPPEAQLDFDEALEVPESDADS